MGLSVLHLFSWSKGDLELPGKSLEQQHLPEVAGFTLHWELLQM